MAQIQHRQLLTQPGETDEERTLQAVMRRRQQRLNELGAEGWRLQTTVVPTGLTFVDTLVRAVSETPTQ